MLFMDSIWVVKEQKCTRGWQKSTLERNYLGGERKKRKEKWAGLFSVKVYLGKNKTKANMAKISICQIWVVVYKCQHIYNFK